MSKSFPILVLGGYGVFGGRISRRLAADKDMKVIVAGRSLIKASTFVDRLRTDLPDADVMPLGVDVPGDLAAAIRQSDAKLVIHTCGPFQGQDYDVARICFDAGVHYIDLADGRDFVDGFSLLDGEAQDAGVLAVSGVSSVPGLSTAVIADLARELETVRRIEMAILPGNRADRGPAVFSGILSYTGRAIPRLDKGRWTYTHGWQDLRRRTLAAPGLGSLGGRWMSACDVPDIALLPIRYPDVERVTFYAGHELPAVHLGLWACSWLVRYGVIDSLRPFHRLLHRGEGLFKTAGTDVGGMAVTVSGDDPDGLPVTRSWTLLAWAGEGPWVPCLPAVILARKIADGKLKDIGAKPCVELFTVEEFMQEAQDFHIACRTTEGDILASNGGSTHHDVTFDGLRRRLGRRLRPFAGTGPASPR